jgi:hypothetical protein
MAACIHKNRPVEPIFILEKLGLLKESNALRSMAFIRKKIHFKQFFASYTKSISRSAEIAFHILAMLINILIALKE